MCCVTKFILQPSYLLPTYLQSLNPPLPVCRVLSLFFTTQLTPIPTVRKNVSGTLPSFSTPGFHNKPIIDLSSTESTPKSVKRSSSDFNQSPSSKRVKKDVISNKENLSVFGKGKAKANEDSEPWTKMELDQESNPFTRLDRDYPQLAAPPTEPAQGTNHSDLNSVCPPFPFIGINLSLLA
jgi:hypothetical protein